MDRPPAPGWETSTFTYKKASEWDEHLVAIDVPQAKAVVNGFISAFDAGRSLLEELVGEHDEDSQVGDEVWRRF